MESPVAVIIVSHREDLEHFEDFAGRNAVAMVSAKVCGVLGLGYLTQDDFLDALSLLQHLEVMCTPYKIALPIVPFPPCASPPSLSRTVFQLVFLQSPGVGNSLDIAVARIFHWWTYRVLSVLYACSIPIVLHIC